LKRLKVERWRFINAATFLGAKAPDGTSQTIMVTKVEGDNVTIDINHPLAGVALNFDIHILSVRESTEEELDHGHTHEEGHSH